ncbi:DUF6318 family protein [Arsenicicoccus bolidensis]|uniref:DUF6318 family protein n=1 Tax=Arsenicicoccus bolidensis TaxID=229480 RepID=UPI003B82E358
MRGHGRLLTAAGLIAAGALAGCSGAAGTSQGSATATHELPPATPGTSAAAPTSSSAATTSTTSATAASPAVTSAAAPAIPAAARAHTPEGAEAFTRYFIDQVNVAWMQPRPGLIPQLSSPNCQACNALEKVSLNLATQNQRFKGAPVVVRSAQYEGDTDQNLAIVRITGEQSATAILGANGQVVSPQRQAPMSRQVLLRESPNGWRVDSMWG